MHRRQKRKSKGGETPKSVFHSTIQGQRISSTMRLNRIREMIARGISYSAVAYFAGIPENRIPRLVERIKELDKAELPGRLARRDELRSKAKSGRLHKWERECLAWLEKPENLELPDKREADAARRNEWKKDNEYCKGCGRHKLKTASCQWHDCPERVIII
jgi:hypothetical protein